MRRGFRFLPLAALLAACNQGASGATAATTADLVHSGPFVLGVQTHVGQNWPAAAIPLASSIGASLLRDGLSWPEAEKSPGRIVFPPQKLEALRQGCRAGRQLILTAQPRNPLYDGGLTANSLEGVAAFVAYLKALVAALPVGCVAALEIGNEINSARGLPVPDGGDPIEAYVGLMRTAYPELKRAAPAVAVLGGSTNAIGTGFLDKLFAKGLLDAVDGIAVHPYRGHAENLDWELRHLSAAMAARGRRVPIWATEFGDYFETPEQAAPALVKLTALLSASGVERATWYALLQQKWFRNMGLYGEGSTLLPAGRAYAFAQRELIRQGRAERIAGDGLTYLFRFGRDRWVAWGAPRELIRDGKSQYFDAQGQGLSGPLSLGANPIVVIGAQPRFGPSAVVADSMFGFGSAPWSYFGRTAGGRLVPLAPLDGQFATSLGDRTLRPLTVSDVSGAAAGTAASPTSVVIRYTVPSNQTLRVQVCLTANTKGDGVSLAVTAAGKPVASRLVTGAATVLSDPIAVGAGDPIDLAIGPAGSSGRGNIFRYRIRLIQGETRGPDCAFPVGGWT